MKNNKGFTLVEIVVVTVVLVVLAAMLIPTMVRYLTKGAQEKIEEDVKNVLTSAQIKLYDLYAEASHSNDYKCIISGDEDLNSNRASHPTTYKLDGIVNCDIHWNPIASEILSLSGLNIRNDDPCAVIIGTGRYDIYANPENVDMYDLEKAYTVYFVIYQPYFSGNTTFVMYADGTIDTFNIPERNENQAIKLKNKTGEEIYIQLYYLKNGKDNNNQTSQVWSHASGHMKK